MMATKSKLFGGMAAALALTLVSGCGETSKKKDAAKGERSLGGQNYVVVEDGGLAEGELSGTGKIAFLAPVADEAAAYEFTFSLEDKGSVSLVVNAAQGLANGITLKLTRNGTKLAASTTTPKGMIDVSAEFASLDASGTISLVADVHNNEKPAHILVWTAGGPMTEDDTIFNSDLDGVTTGNGTGRVWGLELVGAKVTAAAAGAPKFAH